MSEDARYRTKDWLDTYLSNAALTADDDSTEVKFLVSYANPEYSTVRVFIDKFADLVFSLGKPESKPLSENQGVPYAYVENVPIIIECIDKSGITATKLLWKAETELRRIAEEYPEGSKRTIDFMKDDTKRTEGFTVYSSTYMLRYRRPATVSGTPTITWGHGFLDDFILSDPESHGWSEHLLNMTDAQCSMVGQFNDVYKITGKADSVDDEYVYYEKDMTGMSPSTYNSFLIRFKTSVSSLGLGARVELTFADSQTEFILGATAPEFSTTWKIVTGNIIKTDSQISKIRLYADDYPNGAESYGTKYVYYDFVLLHKGTFTFPYVSKPLELDIVNREAVLKPLKRVGNITQYLGMDSPLIVLSGDIDDNSDWGSPLGQKMYELMFERFKDPWQWFTSNLTSCKVELVSFNIKESSEDDAKRQWVLTLRKHDEYCGSNDWVWEYFSP